MEATGNSAIPGGAQPAPDGTTRPDVISRLILPVAAALAIVAAVELFLYATFHPTFWQTTTWLLHDP
jgi:hypothetical protein